MYSNTIILIIAYFANAYLVHFAHLMYLIILTPRLEFCEDAMLVQWEAIGASPKQNVPGLSMHSHDNNIPFATKTKCYLNDNSDA